MLLLLQLLGLLACGGHEPDSGAHDTAIDLGMTDRWMQLDFYYTDYCVYLDSRNWQVTTYREGEYNVVHEGWEWWYQPPDEYVIEGHLLEVVEELDGDCVSLKAYTFEDVACPCTKELPPPEWQRVNTARQSHGEMLDEARVIGDLEEVLKRYQGTTGSPAR